MIWKVLLCFVILYCGYISERVYKQQKYINEVVKPYLLGEIDRLEHGVTRLERWRENQ